MAQDLLLPLGMWTIISTDSQTRLSYYKLTSSERIPEWLLSRREQTFSYITEQVVTRDRGINLQKPKQFSLKLIYHKRGNRNVKVV